MFPTTQKCETISYGEKAEKRRLRLAKWEMKKIIKKSKAIWAPKGFDEGSKDALTSTTLPLQQRLVNISFLVW